MNVKYLFLNLILALSATVFLVSCGGSNTFRVVGEIEGLGTRNLRFYYYNGHSLQVGVASAIDNKFSFEGQSKVPALVTIATGQREILGRFVAENGDAIELVLNVANPTSMKVKGNKTSVEYADFLNKYSEQLLSGDNGQVNTAVEKFVAENPKKQVSAVAFVSFYNSDLNPAHADSILMSISAKARPAQIVKGYRAMIEHFSQASAPKEIPEFRGFGEADSIETYSFAKKPKTLVVISNNAMPYLDSINAIIKGEVSEKHNDLFGVLNIGLEKDTTEWHSSVRTSSPQGKRLWVTGSISSPKLEGFNLRHLPSFAVVDSLGTIIYSGYSLTKAIENLD